jgi:hypothetical protein
MASTAAQIGEKTGETTGETGETTAGTVASDLTGRNALRRVGCDGGEWHVVLD